MKHPEDHQTWRQFLAGDTRAFSALFLKYHPLLLHYGIKLCQDEAHSEECIQDLFCYLYENKDKLPEVHQVNAYLFVSFRRRILRIQKGKQMMILQKTTATDTDIQFSQEEVIIDQERKASDQKKLWQMLNELPARQREVVYLKYYQGLETDEIAAAMDITHQGVLNALYKAFKNLRKTAKKDFKSSFYYFLFF